MFKIITDFGGANIRINDISENVVHLEQEIRDTGEWWFWWNFKVSVDRVETIRFCFDNGAVVHPKGPCVRYDGEEFYYAADSRVNASEFLFTFDKAGVWQFSFAIPYQTDDWHRFVNSRPYSLTTKIAGISEHGRPIELVDANAQNEQIIVVACRHHACESVAAFSMEGLLDYLMTSPFMQKYRIIVMPFVDIDGVEQGDQGKSRLPHDHNRDYIDDSIYRSVKILKEIADTGRVVCLFDLHCPAAWGGSHDHLSLIGLPAPYDSAQRVFSDILQRTTELEGCPIVYKSENDILFGQSWNKDEQSKNCSTYFAKRGALLSFTFEHPFIGDMSKPYSPDDLRAFGKCFGKAVQTFLSK